MNTDEEIKEKARAYWDGYTRQVTKLLMNDFQKYAKKNRFEPGLPSIADISKKCPVPDFTNKKLRISKIALQAECGFSKLEAELAEKILGPIAMNIESFIQTDYSRSTFGLFKDGGAIPFLMKARVKALSQHNKYREEHAGTLTILKKQLKKIPPHSPGKNVNIFQEAINKVEYLHKFSKALIDYLEKEWPASIGLDKNILKDPTKHWYWTPVIEGAYEVLTKETQPPFIHVAACNYIAKLLTSIYPNIWKDDVNTVANRIRARIDNLNQYCVNPK